MSRFVVIFGNDVCDAAWAIVCKDKVEANAVVLHELLHFLYKNYASFVAKHSSRLRTLEEVKQAVHDEDLVGEINLILEDDTYIWMTPKGEKFHTVLVAEEGSEGVYVAFDSGNRCTWANSYNGQEVQSDAGDPIIIDTTSISIGKRWVVDAILED